MPEPILLLIGLVAAGFIVLIPLWRARVDAAADDGAAALRHRVALEVLRDVETDRRAGSLDDAAYAEQLAQAEARAADTRAALEGDTRPAPQPHSPGGRRSAVIAAAAIGAVMLAGSFVPPAGIANQTVVNQELADVEAAEAARQALIRELRGALSADAADTDALSALADAHLAGSSQEDLVRGAVALQLLIALEPERADAYERIMSAYLRAGDHANARAAHDAYVQLASADPVEAAFFDGLIALRGVDDPQRALDAFDRFLELAPDDPRAAMVRGLRDEAGGS
jgi:tetratricopeptide (TPR) repeat protein